MYIVALVLRRVLRYPFFFFGFFIVVVVVVYDESGYRVKYRVALSVATSPLALRASFGKLVNALRSLPEKGYPLGLNNELLRYPRA